MSKILKNIHSDLAFTNNLINWGKSFGRKNLPWNPSYGKKIDPYKVWLSEIMLQQTQFRTGVKYFERFIKHFPNVKNLAESEIETVLSFWSGLGYYARAKNMHKAAKIICSGGKVNFPKSASDWKKLPGIGFSTAAAISAFTVNEKQPIMDANVIRIVARQHKLIERIGSAKLQKKIFIICSKHLPKSNSDMPIYTQSIMDLGALICRPKEPLCDLCPVSECCLSFLEGKVGNYPVKKKKVFKNIKRVSWIIPHTQDSIALVQSKDSKLWENFWIPIEIQENNLIPKKACFLKRFKLPISNFIFDISVWGILCKRKNFEGGVRWFKNSNLNEKPIPSSVKKAISFL